MTCSYAACPEPPTTVRDGWLFCASHALMHPYETVEPEKRTTGRPVTRGCGTRAGAERHRYRNEPVCEPCAEAKRAYKREAARRQRAAA